jgi:hypothetical protein
LQNTNAKRFIFSAYANSLGIVVQQPVKAFLSDVPSASIPISGGLISQSRESIGFTIGLHEILRTGRVSTTVLAEQIGDHYITLATTTVERLNILDVITADAVVSRVTSVYPAGDNRQLDPKLHKARFYLTGSHFDNLKIAGDPEQLEMKSPYASNEGFLIDNNPEPKHVSLFGQDPVKKPVSQFGTIHFGDVEIYSAKVILTMLRVELGCPFAGTADVACACTNGVDF